MEIVLCKYQLYSYFRYPGSLFLRCVLFNARFNIFRVSCEPKKERFSFRKKLEFVWVTKLFWLPTLLLCHSLLLSSSTPLPFPIDVLTQWMYSDVLCDNIMNKQSKIWKSLAMYSICYFRLCFSFSCSDNDLTLSKKSNPLNCYSFLHNLLWKTKIRNSLLVTVIVQFAAKTTNSEKAI